MKKGFIFIPLLVFVYILFMPNKGHMINFVSAEETETSTSTTSTESTMVPTYTFNNTFVTYPESDHDNTTVNSIDTNLSTLFPIESPYYQPLHSPVGSVCGYFYSYYGDFSFPYNGSAMLQVLFKTNTNILDYGISAKLGDFNINDDSICRNGVYTTNIPIFNTYDDCVSFLNGTKPITDAINIDSLTPLLPSLFNETISEVPKRAFIKINNSKASIDWGYSFDSPAAICQNYNVQVQYKWSATLNQSLSSKSLSVSSVWRDGPIISDGLTSHNQSDSICMLGYSALGKPQPIVANSPWGVGISDVYSSNMNDIYENSHKWDNETYYIRVRNSVLQNGKVYHSEWVSMQINIDNGKSDIVYTDTQDNLLPSTDYIPDADIDIPTSPTDIVNNTGTLTSYITNGMGLLGKDGTIYIFASWFNALPPDIWTIVLFGLSVCVIVAIFRVIRG